MSQHRLIFGCGYLGERVARRWLAAGDLVTVVTRSAQRAAGFASDGLSPFVADVTQPDTLAGLPAADTVLYAVGFDRAAGPSVVETYAGGLSNVIAALKAEPERLIYASTTGVYGDAAGGWIDETTPTGPGREGARASLAAECVLTASPLAGRSVRLRLAGLYGPGRVPYLRALSDGEPIAAPAEGYLNLIHADDAAAVVVAAADGPQTPSLLCVSDGSPVVRREYYSEAARLVGGPPPQFTAPDPDSPRAARAAVNRRVRNTRLVAALGFSPVYPSYREGLLHALGSEPDVS
ncbi:NAD dependent epimerase/dehydratase family protein [Pseudobythopirellula maris]|uniref:NAD dependent epimerase/dehydratase family protein n=1 Tax=Pseudobythopirellula maris TaxID=2527991 RepID=A0A5C5ZIN0_9BACT|nr:NAD-dependent epimerase/dehydratase family protein [Pseudobythopirellula maris]TWT86857.1 NAD dependent epimerase/dehydratase family protein [Pseudobythopirellula maris]